MVASLRISSLQRAGITSLNPPDRTAIRTPRTHVAPTVKSSAILMTARAADRCAHRSIASVDHNFELFDWFDAMSRAAAHALISTRLHAASHVRAEMSK